MREPQPLPAWAVEPLDMEGAARALGVSRRTLTSILKDHPIFAPRGRKKVFYPEHISGLREALERPSSPSRKGSTLVGRGQALAASSEQIFEQALALVTASAKPKRKSGRKGSSRG